MYYTPTVSKFVKTAPPAGFEPATFFLTGSCSTIELQGNDFIPLCFTGSRPPAGGLQGKRY